MPSGVYIRTQEILDKLKKRKPPKLLDNPSYGTVHKWLNLHFGKPKKCEKCGVEGGYNKTRWNIHWASKSHTHKRDIKDYFALCLRCHRKYDDWAYKVSTNRVKNPKPNINSTSGFKGVSWDKSKNKWRVYKQVAGKKKFLGTYDNIQSALSCVK